MLNLRLIGLFFIIKLRAFDVPLDNIIIPDNNENISVMNNKSLLSGGNSSMCTGKVYPVSNLRTSSNSNYTTKNYLSGKSSYIQSGNNCNNQTNSGVNNIDIQSILPLLQNIIGHVQDKSVSNNNNSKGECQKPSFMCTKPTAGNINLVKSDNNQSSVNQEGGQNNYKGNASNQYLQPVVAQNDQFNYNMNPGPVNSMQQSINSSDNYNINPQRGIQPLQANNMCSNNNIAVVASPMNDTSSNCNSTNSQQFIQQQNAYQAHPYTIQSTINSPIHLNNNDGCNHGNTSNVNSQQNNNCFQTVSNVNNTNLAFPINNLNTCQVSPFQNNNITQPVNYLSNNQHSNDKCSQMSSLSNTCQTKLYNTQPLNIPSIPNSSSSGNINYSVQQEPKNQQHTNLVSQGNTEFSNCKNLPCFGQNISPVYENTNTQSSQFNNCIPQGTSVNLNHTACISPNIQSQCLPNQLAISNQIPFNQTSSNITDNNAQIYSDSNSIMYNNQFINQKRYSDESGIKSDNKIKSKHCNETSEDCRKSGSNKRKKTRVKYECSCVKTDDGLENCKCDESLN